MPVLEDPFFVDGGESLRIPATDRRLRRFVVPALAAAGASLLAACGEQPNQNPTSDAAFPNLFPGEVVTVQGAESAALYLPIFLIAVAIFVLVEGLLLYMTWRFRRRGSETDLPAQTHGSNRLEIIWTAIPALIVTAMFVVSMNVLTSVQAKTEEPTVNVDVTAFQWQWTFAYPDHGLTYTGAGTDGPEMVLPVDEPVRIRLAAVDVIHSFYVPAFFYKLDAVPGRVNEFEVTIEQPGIYGGQCAEFCGLAHADMFFTVRAVPGDEYDAWVAAEVEAATASPSPAPPSSPPPGSVPPGSPPAGTLLQIATHEDDPLAYDAATLEAPAGGPVTVEYLNDSSLPHNIAFFEGPDTSAPRIAATEIRTGPGALERVTFDAPEAPGDYLFHCDVHPIQMTGTFRVLP
jgi:cytochrome c oxidase subunit II